MNALNNKVAALFAANGAIAKEVALAMAQQGATVYLSSRTLAPVQALAQEINNQGGQAKAFQVDATQEDQIDQFLQTVIKETGRLDIVFNGIGVRVKEGGYGTPAVQLPFEQFMLPLQKIAGSQFLTARLAARHMQQAQQQGTIITLTASLSRIKTPFMTGITAACSAIEGMTRSLAAEFGPAGIKVLCLNPTAMPETRTIQETSHANAATMGIAPEDMLNGMRQGGLLGRSVSTRDIGQLAAFLATDTGALLNSHIIDADFGVPQVI